MSTTPAERRLLAQYAAHTRWSRTRDRSDALAPAREGFLAKLARDVDPNGEMNADELAKAVESARKAFYSKIQAKAAAARRARRGGAA